jgi:beta-mannosidase
VDYYLDKKLAYDYIKCSQQPLCMMFDEPADGKLNLYAVNDTRDDVKLNYTVEDDQGNVILSASADVQSDTSVPVASIPATDEKRYYIIRWQAGEVSGMNHYFANIREIDFDYYKTLLTKIR